MPKNAFCWPGLVGSKSAKEPMFSEYSGFYEIVKQDNKAAKELSEVIGNVEGGCSGAMHHAVVSHLLYVKANGWEKYCKQMRINGD